jgi:hypothetical protein
VRQSYTINKGFPCLDVLLSLFLPPNVRPCSGVNPLYQDPGMGQPNLLSDDEVGYSASRITMRRLGPRLHAAVC